MRIRDSLEKDLLSLSNPIGIAAKQADCLLAAPATVSRANRMLCVARCAWCPRTMKFICVASFILRLCLAVRDAAETLSLRLILHLSRCRHCIYIIVHINIVKSACRARAPLYKISQPFIHALAVRLRLSVSGCTLAARV